MRKPLLYNHMQAAGHQNDTIVVNQPRLTTDETISSMNSSTGAAAVQPQLEMTIITDEEGNQKLIPTSSLVMIPKYRNFALIQKKKVYFMLIFEL